MSEHLFRNLVEGNPLATILIERKHGFNVIAQANEKAHALFGKNLAERYLTSVLRAPVLLEMVENVFEKDHIKTCRFIVNDDRSNVFLDATCYMVHQTHCVIHFEDKSELQKAVQIRRDFVANVSHELKSPLASLMGFIETLRGPAKNDPKAQERFLTIMEQEAQRMNRLVRDLLSLSQVEATERQRPADPIDLMRVLKETIQIQMEQAEKSNAEVVTKNFKNEIWVNGDHDQLRQVFTNLIENAIKYGGPGTKVTLDFQGPFAHAGLRSDAISISVKDTGPGIDEVHLPRLAERFYRVDDHRSRQMGGTGLGLAIVKHIVTRHRGRLAIQSKLGEGSQFTVTLPVLNGGQKPEK